MTVAKFSETGPCLHLKQSRVFESIILGIINTLTTKEYLEERFFMHLSNHVFLSQIFQKYLSYGAHVFFGNLKNQCTF